MLPLVWIAALSLGWLVFYVGARWSARLMNDATAVYGGQLKCPQMRWVKTWFVLWFLAAVTSWLALQPVTMSDTALLAWLAWFALLGLLSLIDARTGLLPNELTLTLMVSGLLWHAAQAKGWLPPSKYTWGMVLGWLLPFCLNRVYEVWRNRLAIGEGDAKLLAGIGAWLGWQALPAVWVCACVAALVYTLASWMAGHGKPSYVTFGPFLATGASSVMLLNYV